MTLGKRFAAFAVRSQLSFVLLGVLASPLMATSVQAANLITDPGFEKSAAGFAPQSSSDTAIRSTVAPIQGIASLDVGISNWGNSVWFQKYYRGSVKGSSLAFKTLVRGVTVNSSSTLYVCAFAYYVNSGNILQSCLAAPRIAGKLVTLKPILSLDPTKAIERLGVRIYLEGGAAVKYKFDATSLDLVVAPAPTPTPTPVVTPTPTPTPVVTPTPTPTPVVTPTPTPTPVVTPTPTPTPVVTPTPTPTPVVTPTPTPTPTPVVTPTPTPTPVVTPTPTPTPTTVPGGFTKGVTLRLEKNFDGASVVSFGLPLPAGVVTDASKMRVFLAGTTQPVSGLKIKPFLYNYDSGGNVTDVRSVLIQFPAAVLTGSTLDIEVQWNSALGTPPTTDVVPFSSVKVSSPEAVKTRTRSIGLSGGVYSLIDGALTVQNLFTGSEARILPLYPEGYLAATGILNSLMTRTQLQANSKIPALAFLSDNFGAFSNGAIYDEGYDANPSAIVDPVANYEGWLYDRCATFLISYAHHNDKRFLRHAMRACSYYVSKIDASGIFTGKPDPDTKYSHLRGVYAYYALTGDETAFTAASNMAKMWLDDPLFVLPYRNNGHIRGVDKLWTERLLGTSIEGLIYGFYLTGDVQYLNAFKGMFETAYKHISTKNQAELNGITLVNLPPQNCFIHSSEQHGEGGTSVDPWCSGWMTELVIDPLLRYQQLTGDPRVDEMFVLLTRFLRDTGTSYFKGDLLPDTFLNPSMCFDPTNTVDPRILVPLYGSGIMIDGKRVSFGDYSDYEHCADATAMTAAAIRALKRQGKFDLPGVGPFATEGDSFMALHEEFSFCAQYAFRDHTRPGRDPRNWTSSALAAGYSSGNTASQTTFINSNKIGYSVHETAPQRKMSWWFNSSMMQFSLLEEAGVSFTKVGGGRIQPAGCK